MRHHTYIGVLDKHGYRVIVDGKPLPLHALYCTDRDWNTAKGNITGYMVEDLVIMWCKLRFVDLTTRLAEATQV